MKVEEFRRFLELKEQHDKKIQDFVESNSNGLLFEDKDKDEYYILKNKLENFLFNNMDNKEKLICKLKNSLSSWRYNIKFGDKAYDTLNELKAIKEILNLLDTYDWKLMYSEYGVADKEDDSLLKNYVTEIAVWEQNHEGQIRNHKVWTTNIPYEKGIEIGCNQNNWLY